MCDHSMPYFNYRKETGRGFTMTTSLIALDYSESHALKYAISLEYAESNKTVSNIQHYCRIIQTTWSTLILKMLCMLTNVPILDESVNIKKHVDLLGKRLSAEKIDDIIKASHRIDDAIDKLMSIRKHRGSLESILLPNWSISVLEHAFIYIQELGLEFESRINEDQEEIELLSKSIAENLKKINSDQIACS